MLQKILKRITNNFGLKVLAAVIAIIIWLVIVNTEDPEKTVKITTTVEIQNQEYLEEQGKTYEVLNNSDKITFNITGRRSVVESMKASDFTATADLGDIENNSQVPIRVSANRRGDELEIVNRSKYVEVFVEDIVSAKIPVEVETNGTVAEGFEVSELQANIKEVTVTGPESIVEDIQRAVAWVEVASMQANTVTRVSLSYYDADGNTIDTTRLTMDHASVTVTIGIMEHKTVPVEYIYSGTPASGYQVVSATGKLTSIDIMGQSDVVATVEKITVSGAELNVTGANQTIEKDVDITAYLPEGISLVNEQDATVTITILLEAETEKTLEMPVSNITFVNIADGYRVEPKLSAVAVTIKGYPSMLNELDAADLKGTADASRIREGEQALTVSLEGDYTVIGSISVVVQVTKETEGSPTDTPEGDTQTQ